MSKYALGYSRILRNAVCSSSIAKSSAPRLNWASSPLCSGERQLIASPALSTIITKQFHSSTSQFIRKKATDSVTKEDPALPTYNEFEPFLIIPNPFRMLHNWLAIWQLQSTWDPSFDVNEFKRGAVQAIITVVDLVGAGEWKNLRGLLDKNILETRSKPDSSLSLLCQSTNDGLNISHHNIQHVRIQNVRVHQIVEHKFCDFFVDIIAFKRQKEKMRDVGYLFQMKFHRNYTHGVLPSWSITGLHLVVSPKEWPQNIDD